VYVCCAKTSIVSTETCPPKNRLKNKVQLKPSNLITSKTSKYGSSGILSPRPLLFKTFIGFVHMEEKLKLCINSKPFSYTSIVSSGLENF
jgi:hypothetical protein